MPAFAGNTARRLPNSSAAWSIWMSRPGLRRSRRCWARIPSVGSPAALSRFSDASGSQRHRAAHRRCMAPIGGSSLLVRAGYGIYDDTLFIRGSSTQWRSKRRSRTASALRTVAACPLTLASGFRTCAHDYGGHLCGRPQFPHRLRAELAAQRAARSARVAASECGLPRHEGHARDAGVFAEHVSGGRRESVPIVSGGIHLPNVQRQFHAGSRAQRNCAVGCTAGWRRR